MPRPAPAPSAVPGAGREPARRRSRLVVGAVLAAWGVAVAGGFAALLGYASEAGAVRPAPARWPAATSLGRATDRASLVLFLHPRCPCSRATVAQLDRAVARAGSGLAATVVFVVEEGLPSGWERGPLLAAARAVPGVVTVVDRGGAEAVRFGARTSGDALVYDREGVLRYRGGLTPLRGHEGGAAGLDAAVDVAAGREPARSTAPVFGCPLLDEEPPCPR